MLMTGDQQRLWRSFQTCFFTILIDHWRSATIWRSVFKWDVSSDGFFHTHKKYTWLYCMLCQSSHVARQPRRPETSSRLGFFGHDACIDCSLFLSPSMSCAWFEFRAAGRCCLRRAVVLPSRLCAAVCGVLDADRLLYGGAGSSFFGGLITDSNEEPRRRLGAPTRCTELIDQRGNIV